MNSTLKNGVSAGLITAIILVGLHFLNFELGQNFSIQLAYGLLIPIVFMVFAIKAERENQEGFISFGEALKTSFFVYMICAIIVAVVQFGLFQTYTDEHWNIISELQMENTKGMMEMMGVDEVAMDESLEETMSPEFLKESSSGIGIQMFAILGNAFIGLLIALVISAIMKRNPTP